MPEDVVKNVGLLQIIELRAATDERPGREFPVGQQLEERPRRDETGDCDNLPAGQTPEPGIHPLEIGHAFGADAERFQPVQIFAADMPFKGLALPLEQHPPDGMVLDAIALPGLVDDAVFNRLCGQNGMSGHRFPSWDRGCRP